jgi:hypothetical protein
MNLLSTTIRKYGFKSLPTIKSEKNIQQKLKECETILPERVQYNSTSMKSELTFFQRIRSYRTACERANASGDRITRSHRYNVSSVGFEMNEGVRATVCDNILWRCKQIDIVNF